MRYKNTSIVLSTLIICLIIFYEYGRIVFDANPIVLGESLSLWTTGFSIMRESILKFGQFPLWNTNIGAGFSIIGYPYIPNLYPFVYPFILAIEDQILSTRVFIFFHIILAGIFFFLFASSLKLSKAAVFFGSITYLSSWFFLSYLSNGFFSSIFTYTWFPLILLFLLKCFKTYK